MKEAKITTQGIELNVLETGPEGVRTADDAFFAMVAFGHIVRVSKLSTSATE